MAMVLRTQRVPVASLAILLLTCVTGVVPARSAPPPDAGRPIAGRAGNGPGPSRVEQGLRSLEDVLRETDPAEWQGIGAVSPEVRSNLAGAGAGISLMSPLSSPNVRANNISGDLVNETQSKAAIAADGGNVVVVWMDSRGFETPASAPPNTFVGYAYSCDWGVTFTDGQNPPRLAANDQATWGAVGVDGDGNFYLTAYYEIARDGSGIATSAGVAVWKGSFSGCSFSWDDPVLAVQEAGSFFDQPFVAADPYDNHVYVAYGRYPSAGTPTTEVVASADGGQTWSAPEVLASSDSPGGYKLAVGPSHELYAVWLHDDRAFFWCDLSNDGADTQVKFAKSVDHGDTWSAATTIADQYTDGFSSGPGSNANLNQAYPTLDVDRSGGPHNGNVYVAWHECGLWGPLTTTGPATAESEPNSTPATATAFTLGDVVSGTASATTDVEYFKVSLTAGQTAHFLLEPQGWACGGATTSFTLRLYAEPSNLTVSPPDTILASSRVGLWVDRIVYTCKRTGTYYLRVFPAAAGTSYTIRTTTLSFLTPTVAAPGRDARDVVLVRSTTGGASWSSKQLLSGDAPEGYVEEIPTVTVDAAGRVYVFWYDRRETESNPLAVNQAQLTDRYMASSSDGGATFGAGQRVSDESSAWPGSQRMNPNVGTSQGAAATGNHVYAAWGDGRLSNAGVSAGDAYTSLLDFEAPNTSFTAGPAESSYVLSGSVLFAWTGSDSITPTAGLEYAVELDGGGYSAFDTSTSTVLSLPDGWHVFRVKARDEMGNVDSTAATRNFAVDGSDPTLLFTLGPGEGQWHIGYTVPFRWIGSDGFPGPATLEYSHQVDAGGYSAWGSTTEISLAGLSPGAHALDVRVRDQAGRITTATRNFFTDVAVRWNVDASGNWNTATNWNTGALPSAADSVVIDRPAGSFTITHNSGTHTARTLYCTEILQVSGSSVLNLSSASSISGSLNQFSGTLNVTGNLTLSGGMTWAGGTMNGAGTTTLTAAATGTIQTGTPTLSGRTFRNEGTVTMTSGFLFVNDGAVFENPGTFTINISSAADLRTGSGTGTFQNAGTLRKLGTARFNMGINTPTTFLQSGLLDIDAGTFAMLNTATVSGQVDVAAGSTLFFGIGTQTFTASSSLHSLGDVNNTGTTVNLSGALDVTLLTLSSGSFNLAQGDTISTLNQSGGTVSVAGNLRISTALTWAGGTMSGTGTTTLAPGGTGTFDGSSRTLSGRTLRNEGTITWTVAENVLNSGATFQNAGSLIGSFGTSSYGFTTTSGIGTVDNPGTIQKLGTGALYTSGTVTTTSSGLLDVDGGTLRFNTGATISGEVDLASGTLLELLGGTQTFTASSNVHGAAISLNGATANVAGSLDIGTLTQSSGSFALTHGDTIPVVNQSGGTLAVTGDLRISTGLTWTGGTMSGTGTTTLAPGATGTFHTANRTLSGRTLRNEGTINWTVWDIVVNSGGVFENAGTLNVNFGGPSYALTTTQGSGTATNTGTIQKSGAGSLSTSGSLTFNQSGLLQISGGEVRLNTASTVSGEVDLVAGTLYSTAGTQTYTSTANVHGLGDLNSNGATVSFSGNLDVGMLTVSGGSFTLSHADTIPTVNVSSGTLAVTGDLRIPTALNWTGGTMSGSGTTLLPAASSATLGGTTKSLSGRTFRNEGTTTWSAGNFQANSGSVVQNVGTLVTTNPSSTIFLEGPIGGGSLENTGTFQKTLSGGVIISSSISVTHSGTFQVDAGLLALDASLPNFSGSTLTGGSYILKGAFRFPGAHIVTNAATISLEGAGSTIQNSSGGNALLDLATVTSAGSLVLVSNKGLSTSAGPFTNSGLVDLGPSCSLLPSGDYVQTAGTTRLNGGTLDPGGLVDIQGGTLEGNGTVAAALTNGGSLNPGMSAGAITVSGGFTQAASGALGVEIGGTSTAQYDRLTSTGAAALDGALNVTLIDGFVPAPLDTFDVLTAASRSGSFSNLDLPALPSELGWEILYKPTGVQLWTAYTDTTGPQTTITSAPPESGWANSSSVAITFTGTDNQTSPANLVFSWRLDGGTWSGFSSATTANLTDLTATQHTFEVRARDVAGNVDETPAARTFTVDLAEPETQVDSGPAEGDTLLVDGATFTFSGSDDRTATEDLVFSYRMDSESFGAFGPDTTAIIGGLEDGSHVFEVRAKDQAGNVDSSPASRDFVVDANPPVISVTQGPAANEHINATSVDFAWTAEDVVTPRASLEFSHRLDGGTFTPFGPDTSVDLTGLSETSHTLEIRARDAAGHVGTLSRTFRVDLTAPTTTVLSGPADGGWSNSTSVSFTWTGTDESSTTGELTYSYRIDADPFSAFAPGTGATIPGLSVATHTFEVRARDKAGNEDATPASRTFTIDVVAPDTQILTGPAPGETLLVATAPFSWSGNDDQSGPGSLQYAYGVDGGFGGYASGTSATVGPMSDGARTFNVRARDLALNVDASPATRSFVVDANAPTLTITSGPSGYTASTTAAFTWSATDAVTPVNQIEYSERLDGGAYSPWGTQTTASFPGVGEGTHTFEVRARDLAGHERTASRNFTTDLTPPFANAPTARVLDSNQIEFIATGTDNFCLQSFRLQVARDTTFASLDLDVTVGSGGTYIYQGLNGFTYYARAYATDCAGIAGGLSGPSNGAVLPDLPDLLVAAPVSVPPAGASGLPIEVSWTVENPGPGGTNAPQWFDDVYLSPTPTLDLQTATRLGRFENLAYLPAGDAYANTKQVDLPRGAAGTYYIILVTDALNQVPETSGANNTLTSAAIDVTLSDYADLRVQEVVVPPTALSSDTLHVMWTVKNQGTGRTDVDSWYDTIFLSPDPVLNFTLPGAGQIKFLDTPLGNLAHTGTLELDSSYTASMNVVLPQGIGGTHHVFVWTDIRALSANQTLAEGGNVFENVSEQNNGGSDTVSVSARPPANLHPVVVDVSPSVLAGSTALVTWTVTNDGLDPTAVGLWYDRVYRSDDTLFSPGTDPVVATVPHSSVLERFASYDSQASIAIANGTSGSFHFFVVTDWDGRVVELDEGDNTGRSVGAMTVTVPPWPDLQASAVSPDPSGQAGSSLNVTWTVQNAGAAGSGAPWTDNLYLSSSPTWNPGNASLLKGVVRQVPVISGGSYTRTTSATLPTNLSGNLYVYVVTDAGNQVFEHTDEGNNASAGAPVTIAPYPAIDLTVTTVDAADTALSGQSLAVDWTVQNLGPGTTLSSSWPDQVYLSTDAVLGGGDLLLTTAGHGGALSQNATYSRSLSIPLPNGLGGFYYVLLRTDPSGSSGDGNLANNVLATAAATYIQPVLPPDLVVSNVAAASPDTAGQPFRVTWRVTNAGAGATVPSSWFTTARLSLDPVYNGGDILLGSRSRTTALGPGLSYDDTLDTVLPGYVSGPYYVVVRTDDGGAVYEASAEGNNAAQTSIQAVLAPPSDLVVEDVEVPEAAVPGDPVTVTWTIRNIGTNPAVGQIRDAIYVSENGTFEPDDPLLALLTRTISLAPGAALKTRHLVSLDRTLQLDVLGNVTAELPGLSPGDYRAIVRTNILNNVRESALDNNGGTSDSTMQVDVPLLALGVPAPGTLTLDQSRYYRLDVGPGLDLTVGLTSNESDATNQLFVAYGRTPTQGDFDFQGPAEFTANPSLLIPFTQAGTYYVLVVARALPSGVPVQNYSLLAEALPFSLTGVSPPAGGRQGNVTVTVRGAGFRPNTQIHLRQNGDYFLSANRVTLVNTTELRARLYLGLVPDGLYDIVASNGDTLVDLANAFTVEPPTALQVTTTAVKPDVIRDNSTAYFTFRYRNTSNRDVPYLRARVLVPDSTLIVDLQTGGGLRRPSDVFPALFPPLEGDHYPAQGGEANVGLRVVDLVGRELLGGEEMTVTLGLRNFPTTPFSVRSLTEVLETEDYIARAIQTIDAARNEILVNPTGIDPGIVTLAADATAFRDTALANTYVASGLVSQEDLDAVLSSAPSIGAGGNAIADAAAWVASRADLVSGRSGESRDIGARPGAGERPFFRLLGMEVGDEAWAPLLGEGEPGTGDSCVVQGIDPECAADLTGTGCSLPLCAVCFPAPIPVPLLLPAGVVPAVAADLCADFTGTLCADAKIVTACDPNALTGPAGYGDQHWIAAAAPIVYTVDFENLSAVAQVPAQRVEIRQPLDADLNLSTFTLGNFGFGTHVISVGTNQASYSDQLFFSDIGHDVRVVAGIDLTLKEAFWIFQSIDPATGNPPTDPNVGFLPVNDPNGRGKGFAIFQIRPKTVSTTGTVVNEQARITFDANAPLLTGTATNTLDATKPASQVAPGINMVTATAAEVSWAGSDGGSGVGTYAVYIRQDTYPFQLLVAGTSNTSLVVELETGHEYGFYTIATDHSGNSENSKTSSEATVRLEPIPTGVETPVPVRRFALLQNYPNPFRRSTTVRFALPEEADVTLEVFDAGGRLVGHLLRGKRFPAGEHAVGLGELELSSGIYFYRLRAGHHVESKKMLVVK